MFLIQNLAERLMLILIEASILVCLVAVVVVRVVFLGESSLSVTEVECLRVGFGLVVVEVEVKDLKVVVKAVVRLVWGCLSGRMYLFIYLLIYLFIYFC